MGIRQTRSYTCGPAALATLIHSYMGRPATEREIATLAHTYDAGTTTLSGLREACEQKGLAARPISTTLEGLDGLVSRRDLPVLVHFAEPEEHFVLYVGRCSKGLMVFDPARGNRTLGENRFRQRWSGIALVVDAPATGVIGRL